MEATLKRRMREEFRENIGPLTTLKLGVFLYLVQCSLLINGEALLGDGFSREVALIYIILPLGLLAYSSKNRTIVEKLTVIKTLKMAFVGFVVTVPLVIIVYMYGFGMQFGSVQQSEVLGTIFTQAVFVAPVEELMFRWMIPTYAYMVLPRRLKLLGLIGSQITFSLFHMGVYQSSAFPLVIAFIIGMIWLAAARNPKLGIGFTIGSHVAYNLTISGIMIGNIVSVI